MAYGHYYTSSEMYHGSVMNIMGTRLDLLLFEKEKDTLVACWSEIQEELNQMQLCYNKYDKNSETFRLTKKATTQPVKVSEQLWSILEIAQDFFKETLGLFDITFSGCFDLLLDKEKHTVESNKVDLKIDLGGIAKGYALQKINRIISNKYNIKQAFVNFGDSSMLGIGTHPYGDCWPVTLNNPFDKHQTLCEMKLKDNALSVSGNMPTHMQHIWHPKKKSFQSEHQVVCVVDKDPLVAEVLSTVLMIATEEERREIIKNFNCTFEIYKNL